MTTTATDYLSLNAVQINELVENQRRFFDSGITRSYAFRKAQLQVLKQAVKRYERQFVEALHQDLRKDEFEAYATELGPLYKELDHAILHLKAWMEPSRVATPMMFFPSRSYTIREPLGVTLHISPWNFPVILLFGGMIAAIAGGNTLILKPSELCPATTAVMEAMINETYEPEYIAVITGPGHLVTTEMIEQYHFDHILYTGSTAVGKIIMQAAAKHLSPVTLELGGKSPAIVTESAALSYAARKIAWGKLMNAGQICVTNDYVLVHVSVKDAFLNKLKQALSQ